jgi:hypothetical protein
VVLESISEAQCLAREIRSGHIMKNSKEIMILVIVKIIGGTQRVLQLSDIQTTAVRTSVSSAM